MTVKQAVSAALPVAPYLGGKRNLAKTITPLIDRHDHKLYAEPFVGMGGVFLRRQQRPRAEVINDGGRDVANLFRLLQRHYPQFIEVMRFQITSRSAFEELIATDPDTLTDLERAARFLYLQRTAFGGKVSGKNFGVAPDRPARFNLTTLEPMLQDLHERLSGVVIECLDFEPFISRYDRPTTLFYLDPPYWGSEGDYGTHLFSRADFDRLSACLSRLKGQFIMSLNDVEGVRMKFSAFHVVEVKVSYSVAVKAPGKGKNGELLISNFRLDQTSG